MTFFGRRQSRSKNWRSETPPEPYMKLRSTKKKPIDFCLSLLDKNFNSIAALKILLIK